MIKKIVKMLIMRFPISYEKKEKLIIFLKAKYIRLASRKNFKDLNKLNKKYIEFILQIPQKSENYYPLTDSPYKREKSDPKIIAYYLTQFSPCKENDEWWGKGTTEWNNVCRAVPMYVGHYQPRLPGELGFYDLRLKENFERQVELAKIYGIYGFSFYFYWFGDGRRILHEGLDLFVNSGIDFPFSFCWANESWTRRFDGTNLDILIEQKNDEHSCKEFIKCVAEYMKDKRYITINQKKIITVYKPHYIENSAEVLLFWREYCRVAGLGEIYIIAVLDINVKYDHFKNGYDAITEFHPGTIAPFCKKITTEINYVDKNFSGFVFDYKEMVENKKYFNINMDKLYRSIFPMWDNSARRINKGLIYDGSTPYLYKNWLIDIIRENKKRKDLDDNIIFINAWNEWGEGAYLEPDRKFGYGYLQMTKEAIEEERKI